MGQRGPKRTPTATLQVRGSWRAKQREAEAKRKEQKAILHPAKPPRAPRWLSKAAQKEWRKYSKRLWELRLLHDLTLTWWGLFFQMLGDYKEIQAQVAGLIEARERGGLFPQEWERTDLLTIKRLMSMRTELSREIMKGLRECGLHPEDIGFRPKPENSRARFFDRPAGQRIRPPERIDGGSDEDEDPPAA